ncbi:Hsp70 protein-domain-containing protein [Fomitopsis serialis]|uniref:Hsp70 protein-domain-containing protein n=1 Tax=Fomitopsis serialis TaxID=139415 RepID=UPI002007C6A3|nr:Hsp70 protein-domain-containing protein [Neoantrodia serialis]KAH9911556.1 Hsp70 protein-domain-containing protein [Neoantrodia serialis]
MSVLRRTSRRLPIVTRARRRARTQPRRPFGVSLAFKLLLLVACALLCSPMANARTEAADPTTLSYGAVIGIDIGATYSRVAVHQNGSVQAIPNSFGQRATRSLVHFVDGLPQVYDPVDTLPDHISDFNALLGSKYDDPDVQRVIGRWPFPVLEREGKPVLRVEQNGTMHEFTPESLTATMLASLKAGAEAYLGSSVTDAVLTVPAYYNDAQRHAIRDAASLANLTVLRVVNEPQAAAVAYGLDQEGGEYAALVVDLGGGSLDITLLSVDDGVFEILAISSNSDVGGREFDERLVGYWVQKHAAMLGEDVIEVTAQMQRLRWTAQHAKEALSSRDNTSIRIEVSQDVPPIEETLTRTQFEALSGDLFNRTVEYIDRVLQEANRTKDTVDRILLIGGASRIQYIRQLVTSHMNKEPLVIPGMEPDEVIVSGAAVTAAIISGIGWSDNSCILAMSIAPLSVGVEADGGRTVPVVSRNTVLPTRRQKLFSTAADNQTSVTIKVHEGENFRAEDNRHLCSLELTDIASASAGVLKIVLTLDMDEDGVLQVTAMDEDSGHSASVSITNEKSRPTDDEIQRMVEEAEEGSCSIDRPTPTIAEKTPPCSDCLATRPVDVPPQSLDSRAHHIMFMMKLCEKLDNLWYAVRDLFARADDTNSAEEVVVDAIREL